MAKCWAMPMDTVFANTSAASSNESSQRLTLVATGGIGPTQFWVLQRLRKPCRPLSDLRHRFYCSAGLLR